MDAYVEVWGSGLPELFPLEADRTTIGRAPSNAITLSDPTVSQLHAVIEAYGMSFALRDVGSANGTFLNGERVMTEHRLRPGDEIRLGETRMVFRQQQDASDAVQATAPTEDPPELTRREREVLVALCRSMAAGGAFIQPAGTAQLASELVVSESAVKFHLANLYDKFGLHDAGQSRRLQLANEAIRRRAVTMADLRSPPRG
ncbi:MAG: FHA domain-containing protein [Actinomycetota bacterium]|nr:FHA domain-containing protein [Actinomycetota bacterium]